jgi:hypothetical protein
MRKQFHAHQVSIIVVSCSKNFSCSRPLNPTRQKKVDGLLGYVFKLACQNIKIARLNPLSMYSISTEVFTVRGTQNAECNQLDMFLVEVALSTPAAWRAIAVILDMRDVRYLVDPAQFSAFIHSARRGSGSCWVSFATAHHQTARDVNLDIELT